MSNTTLRYKAIPNRAVDSHNITDEDEYQYGCEFEFYIDIETYDFTDAVERIRNKIQTFSNADILVDLVSLPTDEGALEILCQSSRISTTQGQTHGTNTRYTSNIATNS